VQRLGAGAERPDAEAGDRGLVLVQQGYLLRQGQAGEQVGDPLGQRRADVLVGVGHSGGLLGVGSKRVRPGRGCGWTVEALR
jgi:hypothetical protein